MKKFIFAILMMVVFMGCDGIDVSNISDEDMKRIAEQAIVCEKPYIRHGVDCCLDQDENNICDEDEGKEEPNQEKVEEKPQVEEKPHVEEKVECEDDVTLSGKIVDEKIKLKWDSYSCDDFKGYKVVWSDSVSSPKYPDDGYILYITNQNELSLSDKIRGETNYYSITVLTKGGSVYSNAIKLVHEVEEEEEGMTIADYELNLEYEVTDTGRILLKWTPYTGKGFKYYKVVWTQNENLSAGLQYPDNDYIGVITKKEVVKYKVPIEKYLEGTNYYRISAIFDGFKSTKDDEFRVNSNLLEIEY